MAQTTKLIVYNGALRELASPPLLDLVTASTRLQELDGAFDHAVEHMLAKRDWNFARRRALLSGVADASFPPYVYRFTKPGDYLRKCWLKAAARDAHQIDHAEVGAVIYAFAAEGLLEYICDHADIYDPANWPPHFTRCMTLYLAQLTAPKLARATADLLGKLEGQLQSALADAEDFEAVFLTNAAIPPERQPVLRRALEFLGQVLAGSVALHSQGDKLRWAMNEAWDHCVKYVLELGAWNFASRRALLTGGTEPVPGGVIAELIEGYSLPPAADPAPAEPLPDMAGYRYGFLLPEDFLHKIWLKRDANDELECDHQFLGVRAVYANHQPVVLEYVARNEDTVDPRNWSANFLEAVAAYLAVTVSPELVIEVDAKGRARVAANEIRTKLEAVWLARLSHAKSLDAIQQYPKRIPNGRFVRARLGGGMRIG